MDSLWDEHLRREELIHKLNAEFYQRTVLTREWLSNVELSWGRERLIDTSKGIWNPRSYAATLTIVSNPESEYDDGDHGNSLFRYSYEKRPAGQDPTGGSNRKLREAMRLGLPVIMLQKLDAGGYVPIAPVYVVKDEPEHQRFLLALDEGLRYLPDPAHLTEDQRRYAERVVKQRMHQPVFRSHVLKAYDIRCAVCELKKAPLLDAAHITPDTHDDGRAIVTNGLALCKIHHAAYDEQILGISPDYVVHVSSKVLVEVDGPMLKYGLQQMDRRPLWLPQRAKDRPDQERLSARFDQFKQLS